MTKNNPPAAIVLCIYFMRINDGGERVGRDDIRGRVLKTK